MWVIETLVDGEPSSWELSPSIPRNSAGDPVDSGTLDADRVVVGSRDTFDTLLAFLRERSQDRVRVGKVELAWEAAERRGSARERTVPRVDQVPQARAEQAAAPVEPRPKTIARQTNRRGPSSPLTGVFVLLVLAAIVYFALQQL